MVGGGAGEMAWLSKCLLHQREDLSLIPRTYVEMSGIVAHAYKPCAGKVETVIPGAHWPAILFKLQAPGSVKRSDLIFFKPSLMA